jgi:hypothetical protein
MRKEEPRDLEKKQLKITREIETRELRDQTDAPNDKQKNP